MAAIKCKKICLITPSHIASNPRLVKEAQALAANGYAVHLIFTQYVDYLVDFDFTILNNNPNWTYNFLNQTSKNVRTRLKNYALAAIQKICLMLLLSPKKSDLVIALAVNRYFFCQLKKAIKVKADLYIAHNLAALPVAVFAAKKLKVKYGFDAEDFHRNEVSDDPKHTDVQLKTIVENTFLPKTDYLTASSPSITRLYQRLFPSKKVITVLNAFPVVKEVQLPFIKPNEPLKLFWFSQTIGLNRGLQDVFSALKLLENEQIELHLLGFLADKTSIELQNLLAQLQFKNKPAIIFHPPVNADQLPVFAAQFNIGLATENSIPLNRDICLTNKVFTYLQAGLAVIASDTTAQKQFINENPNLGFCYEKGNAAKLAAFLKHLIDEPELLLQTKREAYFAARTTLNWETESTKFLKVVEETLTN